MFRAKLVRAQPPGNKPSTIPAVCEPAPGMATPRSIGGVEFTGAFRLYAGTPDPQGKWVDSDGVAFGGPNQEQLDCNELICETVDGVPWPNSATDRHGKREGKNAMLLASLKGEWPTPRERELQSEVRIRAADREKFARERLRDQGLQQHEIDATVRKTVTPIVRAEAAARAKAEPVPAAAGG